MKTAIAIILVFMMCMWSLSMDSRNHSWKGAVNLMHNVMQNNVDPCSDPKVRTVIAQVNDELPISGSRSPIMLTINATMLP